MASVLEFCIDDSRKMMDYSNLYDQLEGTKAAPWLKTLPRAIDTAFDPARHGDLERWLATIQSLPHIEPSSIDLNADAVRMGKPDDLSSHQRESLREMLDAFHPWRKGPFDICGIYIDTEWRSDRKWKRLTDAIQPLQGRRVLDVGSGNGYYGWRMLGEGANLVVGIDPFLLYAMQYQVIRHFIGDLPAFVVPLGIEELPESVQGFDTVFSMGVLYHRRSPALHLERLKKLIARGGELVLETLVIEGVSGDCLQPVGRYAMMRNVWSIPSPDTLLLWLKEAGYKKITLVDVTKTSQDEQRSTAWMRFHSLPDFLDPADSTRTIEGYPAPRRAIVTATH